MSADGRSIPHPVFYAQITFSNRTSILHFTVLQETHTSTAGRGKTIARSCGRYTTLKQPRYF